MTEITKEAIEAASATYLKNHWEAFSEHTKRPVRELMKEALEAALPFLAPIAGEGKVPEDATDEMIDAALSVDWSNEDERGAAHNIWHAMRAKLPATHAAAHNAAIADELTAALDGAFVTTTSGGGQRPHLTVTFPENSQIRRLYDALAAFSSLRRNPTTPGKESGQEVEPVSVPEGVELAARFVEKRLNDYVQEHGSYDHSTGVTEFPGNGDEYVYELEEIVEGIRALAAAPQPNPSIVDAETLYRWRGPKGGWIYDARKPSWPSEKLEVRKAGLALAAQGDQP
ncbi:unknown [Sinorhizobium phage PBC5]|uniref:hypothetical protein n=1 Tax=Sinorhizobium phage PBC5 TaxID=179237 RepID=UPI000009BC29|nr:hypothetical protein PBC5_gp59 [Sinorhizobium phage PBC5]AAL49619.1 unknown [Sinorhizobium phage PBC5]